MRNVGAIILAAGGSSRLGQPKQLLMFEGETLVRRAARAATDAGCGPVVVVVGATPDSIANELRASGTELIDNADWARGLGTSIRCGLQHLISSRSDLEAVVLLTCDQPFVDGIIRALLAERARSGKPIVASSYAGTVGIPALFGHSSFESLLALPDDSGAKPFLQSHSAEVATIVFERGAIDLDTPAQVTGLTS